MKKRKVILLCFVCILLLSTIIWHLSKDSKIAIIDYVTQNRVSLGDYAISIIENDGFVEGAVYNGWKVSCYKENGMVQFLVKARGIVPASEYEGFYYSKNDKPLGFQGAEVELIKADTGWIWEDPNSDNRGYTERIADNWYWFEASL